MFDPNTIAVIACLFSGSNSTVGTLDEGDRLMRLIDSTEHAHELSVNLQTEFVVSTWGARPLDKSIDSRTEVPMESHAYRMVVRDTSYCVIEQLPPNAKFGLPGATLRSLWNGKLWFSESRQQDSLELFIEARPSVNLRSDCWGLFSCVETTSMLGASVSDFLRVSTLLNYGEDETSIRVRVASTPTTQADLVFEKGNPIRLKSIGMDLYGAPTGPDAGKITAKLEYAVEEWSTYGGRVLPKRAHRILTLLESQSQKARGGKPTRGLTLLERRSTSFDGGDEKYNELFQQPPLADGLVVVDKTLKCAFEVGSNLLTVDSTPFEVAEPIRTLVRSDLPDVVAKAHAKNPVRKHVQAYTSVPDASEAGFDSRLCRCGIFGGFGAIAGGVMVTLRRRAWAASDAIRRRGKAALTMLCTVAVASAVGWATHENSHAEVTAGPLAGDLSFDFGDITNVTGKPLQLTHTFSLRNSSSGPLRIEKIGTSCGCTKAIASRTELNPGDDVQISATLELGGIAQRREKIWVNLGENGVVELQVSATVRTTTEFYAAEAAVLLDRDKPEQVILVALTADDKNAPGAPALNAPEGVLAEFKGWRLVYHSDEAIQRPARWQAIVQVSQRAEKLGRRPKLEIKHEAFGAKVDLSGLPWD